MNSTGRKNLSVDLKNQDLKALEELDAQAEEDEKLEQMMNIERKWAEKYDQNLTGVTGRNKSIIASSNHIFDENEIKMNRSPKELSDVQFASPYLAPSRRIRSDSQRISYVLRKESSKDFEKKFSRNDIKKLSMISNVGNQVPLDQQSYQESKSNNSSNNKKVIAVDNNKLIPILIPNQSKDDDSVMEKPQKSDDKISSKNDPLSEDKTPVIGSSNKGSRKTMTIIKMKKEPSDIEMVSLQDSGDCKPRSNILDGTSLKSILNRNKIMKQMRRKSGERFTDAQLSSYAKQFTKKMQGEGRLESTFFGLLTRLKESCLRFINWKKKPKGKVNKIENQEELEKVFYYCYQF
jgi:hypothetical protein